MIVVEKGDAFRVENTIKDYDGDPVDPDSHIIRLIRPDVVQEGGDYTAPTKTGVGMYYQDLAIPAEGPSKVWKVEWRVYISGEQSTTTILVVVSPYCTASDVRQIIHTSLTDEDIVSIITSSDAVIDRRIGAQSPSDSTVRKLSMLLTAKAIKARQPRSVATGEYREDSGDVVEVWGWEIEGLFRLYASPTFKASGYRHIDEDERYPAEEGG